ncbi:MAG: HAD family hydrolase [Marinilabiliaceae bacterium]|nr:HAD family hydrolase [Marinilabiliaceae bacterium]
MNDIKVIGFDADDTLWVNETFFRETEKEFANLLKAYAETDEVYRILYKVEVANMSIYGYGIKAFVLSLIETANLISGFRITARETDQIIQLGKEMLNKPVELLEGVEEVLQKLHGHYRLIVATKGDLLDQERKLKKSGLIDYFHHIEVMSDKTPDTYKNLIHHLDIQSGQFLMIGNSMKSDILPVIELGGYGIHVPFHTTWHHEVVSEPVESENYREVVRIGEVLDIL